MKSKTGQRGLLGRRTILTRFKEKRTDKTGTTENNQRKLVSILSPKETNKTGMTENNT